MPFVYLSAIIGALLVSLHGESADDEILEPDPETCLLGRVCVSDKAGGKNVFADCLVRRKRSQYLPGGSLLTGSP
jgi:hypothetical protein